MRINVVTAGRLHAPEMAEILNEIIAIGGTTSIVTPVDREHFLRRMQIDPDRTAWHVAESDEGRVMGFQWIAPEDYLPDDAADISTFARIGYSGLGIGSALFKATEASARRLGYKWINANIRTDNIGGRAYYQSRGFEPYGEMRGVQLSADLIRDKVLARYDLT